MYVPDIYLATQSRYCQSSCRLIVPFSNLKFHPRSVLSTLRMQGSSVTTNVTLSVSMDMAVEEI